jgi:hypothetical protein
LREQTAITKLSARMSTKATARRLGPPGRGESPHSVRGGRSRFLRTLAGLPFDQQLQLIAPPREAPRPSSLALAGGSHLVQMQSVRQANDERSSDSNQAGETAYEVHAEFESGQGKRPELRHDHGFLDDGSGNLDLSRMEPPTADDRQALGEWSLRLMAADFLMPDLPDAVEAYRHYLTGGGAPRCVDYGRFLREDSSGQRVLESAIEDAMLAAGAEYRRIAEEHPDAVCSDVEFQLHSLPIVVGDDSRYPYPSTQNWQKAIGGHTIWLDCRVTVRVGLDPSVIWPEFFMELTINMEDMFNFNPGSVDIATGLPDEVNGRFQVVGLAQEFVQTGTVTIFHAWDEPSACGAPREPSVSFERR